MEKTVEEILEISKKKKGNKDYIEGWNDAIHTANRLNGEIEALNAKIKRLERESAGRLEEINEQRAVVKELRDIIDGRYNREREILGGLVEYLEEKNVLSDYGDSDYEEYERPRRKPWWKWR